MLRWSTPPRLMRALAVAAVVGQGGIAITGSVVRVTGSGLGCPTWPQCFPGSLVPTPHPEVATLHQYVEFGNRLLTFALVVVAGACLVAALLTRPRRRRLTLLAAVMPLGVVAQAVLGGVTVLTGLAWQTVALHFLVSMPLVWCAVLLVRASSLGDLPPGTPVRPVVARSVRRLLAVTTAVLVALLTAGTLVTSAGPHAGDAATPRLAAFSVPDLVGVHWRLLVVFLVLLVALGVLLHRTPAPRATIVAYRVLVIVTLAQGALGGTQYALGVPEVLVALHVLGAVLTLVGAAALWATTSAPAPSSAPVADRVPAGAA